MRLPSGSNEVKKSRRGLSFEKASLKKAEEGPFLNPGRLEKGKKDLKEVKKVELEIEEAAGALA